MNSSNMQAFNILEFTTDKNTDRYKHLLGCFNLGKDLLFEVNVSEDIKTKILNTLLLHDIGYSDKIKITGEHSVDGYNYLLKNYPEVCFHKSILLHSDKINQSSEKNLDLVTNTYNSMTDVEFITLILLDYCDTHIDAYGNECTINSRWDDLRSRYSNNKAALKTIDETYDYALHIESIVNYILDRLDSMGV